ncbi:MAG: hypothetical protein LUC22_00330 [Prevotella sp.]|nr:hypothetical protein [Prevotella sp.]
MVCEMPNVSMLGWYPVRVTAELLGVHENTVRSWIGKGVFRPGEYNRRVYGRNVVVIKGRAIQRVWGAMVIGK